MNLDDFKYRATAIMEVIPPSGDEPIASITFAGPSHEKGRAQAKRLHHLSQRQTLRYAARPSLEQAERANVDLIVERMVGWEGIKRRDDTGEVVAIPFSEEGATEMLMNPALGWLFGQCYSFLAADRNFLPLPRETAPTMAEIRQE